MADIIVEQGLGVPATMETRYAEQPDGTHALVVAAVGASGADPVEMADAYTPSLQSDTSADDSDKTFTVPAATIWQVLSLYVAYTSTADVGNRQLVVEVQDGSSNVIGQIRAGVVQAASLTYSYMFAPGLADLTSVRDTTFIMTPLPASWVLPAGYVLRIYDSKAIAAAADDMILRLLIAARAA